MKEIFFCENNVSKGLETIIEKLQVEFSDLTIYQEPCLGYCGECMATFYAMMDSDMITGETPEELYENIKSRLQ
ncbi:DUF1450 domain-containing protein [Hathewaya histolytica]|uniref:Uncharacterized protein conserved in bacteria n=1 Tax=Hathewaya histolytica TaxID=1498 RepID=A0A4U9RKA7_HATHI|nr:DUF1450 domain-containing protein [Hathewaya histolytica]VTQ89270.1 Uncharacterized protein conserved in bacteria [Hathewaya histolytica]